MRQRILGAITIIALTAASVAAARQAAAQQMVTGPGGALGLLGAETRAVARRLETFLLNTALSAARSAIDLSYEAAVATDSGKLAVVGVYAGFETADDYCEVTADRVELPGLSRAFANDVAFRLSGVTVALACLPDGPVRLQAAALGYRDGVAIDEIALDLNYRITSGGLDAALDIDVVDGFRIVAETDFYYVGADFLELQAARLAIEDRGGWSRLLPVVETAARSPADAFAGEIEAAALSLLLDAPQRLQPTITDPERRFAAELSAAIASFVATPNRIEIVANPDGVAYFDEEHTEIDSIIAELGLSVTAADARASTAPLPYDVVAAVVADGPPAEQPALGLAVADALASGFGAPMDLDAAGRIYATLASRGSVEALNGLAQVALARGDAAAAYAHTLRAQAAGAPGARGRLLTLSAGMDMRAVLDAERGMVPADADAALLATGHARDFLSRARAYERGDGAPYSRFHAAVFASLAKAAGDAGAQRVFDRVTEGFDAADMAAARRTASNHWHGGLGARIAPAR